MAIKTEVFGNTRSLPPGLVRRLERLSRRRVEPSQLVSSELAREMLTLAKEAGRRLGILISREGVVEYVIVGSREILYLPDLGRYRLGAGRLRRLRLVFTDLSRGEEPSIPQDIMTDLEKLRLDLVAGIKSGKGGVSVAFAHLEPTAYVSNNHGEAPTTLRVFPALAGITLDISALIEDIEANLSRISAAAPVLPPHVIPAALVAVSQASADDISASLDELQELARTASVHVIDRIIQRRTPDPKSVLGKGKLEQVVLHCLRLGVELLIFDGELRPAQWRAVTNATELKVIDRSMLILDIFARRAQTSEGRLQVELAQLRYNLPRLVERDSGLSRLTGGIGGRGPGETKLEISRRRSRDRINDLEKQIQEIKLHRSLKRRVRQERQVPLVALVGYTNVGKSTLFNRLTGASVLAEDKLFATLDPYQRKMYLPLPTQNGSGLTFDARPSGIEVVVSDTVGFIRDLPEELVAAFQATLEELYHASVFVHVIDASDIRWREKIEAVHSAMSRMDLSRDNEILVANKVDLADKSQLNEILAERDCLAISALKGVGLGALKTKIAQVLCASGLV